MDRNLRLPATSPSADQADESCGPPHPSLATLTLPERKRLCRQDLKLALLDLAAPRKLKD